MKFLLNDVTLSQKQDTDADIRPEVPLSFSVGSRLCEQCGNEEGGLLQRSLVKKIYAEE